MISTRRKISSGSKALADQGVKHRGKLGRFMHLLVDVHVNRTETGLRATRSPDRRIDGFSKLPKRVQFCIASVAKQHSLLSSTGGDRALGRFWPIDARL